MSLAVVPSLRADLSGAERDSSGWLAFLMTEKWNENAKAEGTLLVRKPALRRPNHHYRPNTVPSKILLRTIRPKEFKNEFREKVFRGKCSR